jgi:hypothetical protein
MIKNILAAGMDKQTLIPLEKSLPVHSNIRGPEHYQ